jgi:hypothetical protein
MTEESTALKPAKKSYRPPCAEQSSNARR